MQQTINLNSINILSIKMKSTAINKDCCNNCNTFIQFVEEANQKVEALHEKLSAIISGINTTEWQYIALYHDIKNRNGDKDAEKCAEMERNIEMAKHYIRTLDSLISTANRLGFYAEYLGTGDNESMIREP